MSEYEYGIRNLAYHYGIMHQLKKLSEEVWRLKKAIIYNKCPEEITEEIADCYVLMEQIEHLACIDKQDIEKEKERKVQRQLERIINENQEWFEEEIRKLER